MEQTATSDYFVTACVHLQIITGQMPSMREPMRTPRCLQFYPLRKCKTC